MACSNFIHQNLSCLRDNTYCNRKLLDDCVKAEILTKKDRNSIEEDEKDRALIFWTKVLSFSCMNKLADIFSAHGQNDVVQILLKATRDDKKDQQFVFVNNIQPLRVIVREPKTKLSYPDSAIILPKVFVGLALIINISEYNNCGWKRHGAQQDTKHLGELWSKMGYDVRKQDRKFDRNTLKYVVDEFLKDAESETKQNLRSYMIYLGCRGNDNLIILSDNDKISYKEFVLMFSRLDKEKPKFFLIQAIPGCSPKSFQKFGRTIKSSVGNAFICSLREPWTEIQSIINVGSWLLYNFVDVFMRDAYRRDVETMMNNVKENIKLSLGGNDENLFNFINFCTKSVHFDLSKPGENTYSIYISLQSANLSKICKNDACFMNVIKECTKQNIITYKDQKELVSRSEMENTDVDVLFWRLVTSRNIRLNELIDIFYGQRMYDVVNILHRAKRDDGSDDVCMVIENWQPLKVKVEKPYLPVNHNKRDDNQKKDFYKLDEDFIGLALVINIIEYDKCGSRRHGAEKDGTYMTELWSQLGYKVIQYEGYIGKDKFEYILQKFVNLVKKLHDLSTSTRLCQSCVVYIGCHGSKGVIDLSDETSAKFYEDFIFKFKDLPNGIPKIVVIQSCQYEKEELKIAKPKINSMLESMEHLILCYSSMPGEESNRDVFVGSLYTYVFSQVFMTLAYEMELQDLLKKVDKNLMLISDGPATMQKCSYQPYGMKPLYFNIQP